jgi:hypothetical protein
MPLSENRAGFPKLVQVATASVSERPVLQAQEPRLVHALAPETLTTDDAYTQARRIRRWAQAGGVLLTPALRWVKGRYATAYHRFIGEPQPAERLRSRRTALEPVFDLLAPLSGATDNHKQLPLQGLANVRTCLALATLTLQVAMIAKKQLPGNLSRKGFVPIRGSPRHVMEDDHILVVVYYWRPSDADPQTPLSQ